MPSIAQPLVGQGPGAGDGGGVTGEPLEAEASRADATVAEGGQGVACRQGVEGQLGAEQAFPGKACKAAGTGLVVDDYQALGALAVDAVNAHANPEGVDFELHIEFKSLDCKEGALQFPVQPAGQQGVDSGLLQAQVALAQLARRHR